MSVTGDAEDGHEISIPEVPVRPRGIKQPPERSAVDGLFTMLFMIALFGLAIVATFFAFVVAAYSGGCLGNSCNGAFISAGVIVAAAWPWLVFVGGLIWVAKAMRGWGTTFWIPLVLAPVMFLGLIIGGGIGQLAFI